MRIENGQERMRALQERHHPHCLLCGAQNNMGLQVPFRACENGSVTASLTLPAELQGYRGVAHGGIVTSLLDAVMVNCLFSHGIVAMNAEMTAHVTQGTRMLARATAKFLEVPDATANFDSETLAIQAGKTKARP